MSTWVGKLFTTSPTATSSLFFGFATYAFRGRGGALGGGDRGVDEKDRRGARPNVEPGREEFVERDRGLKDREPVDVSDGVGETTLRR